MFGRNYYIIRLSVLSWGFCWGWGWCSCCNLKEQWLSFTEFHECWSRLRFGTPTRKLSITLFTFILSVTSISDVWETLLHVFGFQYYDEGHVELGWYSVCDFVENILSFYWISCALVTVAFRRPDTVALRNSFSGERPPGSRDPHKIQTNAYLNVKLILIYSV